MARLRPNRKKGKNKLNRKNVLKSMGLWQDPTLIHAIYNMKEQRKHG